MALGLRTANREPRTANREPRTANREPRVPSRIRICPRLSSLLDDYPHNSHCILVVHLEWALRQLPIHSRDERICESLSCWDGAFVLFDSGTHDALVHYLASSGLALRLAFGEASASNPLRFALWAAQLNRLIAGSCSMPRFGRSQPSESELRMLRKLPLAWRGVIRMALLRPEQWDCKRIARECSTTPRTLERVFKRSGLDSPGKLLRLSREKCRADVAFSRCGDAAASSVCASG